MAQRHEDSGPYDTAFTGAFASAGDRAVALDAAVDPVHEQLGRLGVSRQFREVIDRKLQRWVGVEDVQPATA